MRLFLLQNPLLWKGNGSIADHIDLMCKIFTGHFKWIHGFINFLSLQLIQNIPFTHFSFFFFPCVLRFYFTLLVMDQLKVLLNLVMKLVSPLVGPSCSSVHVPLYLQWLSSRISLERLAVTMLPESQHALSHANHPELCDGNEVRSEVPGFFSCWRPVEK